MEKKKNKLKYKKCPLCKGKGKLRINAFGLTKDENKKVTEKYANSTY